MESERRATGSEEREADRIHDEPGAPDLCAAHDQRLDVPEIETPVRLDREGGADEQKVVGGSPEPRHTSHRGALFRELAIFGGLLSGHGGLLHSKLNKRESKAGRFARVQERVREWPKNDAFHAPGCPGESTRGWR